ncbi:epoxyqueuosine reductase QueH [Acholeplasma sp. OttesenSCG-928-E16]|nr:epoxyqueuosine reductase QueH [Acholeplasma sp. OttesenSCG-928-E16]
MKILLHICCAPCAIYPLESIKSKNHQVKGLYFNPNIHPLEEFNKRKETLKEYAKMIDLDVVYFDDYMEEKWPSFGDKRCLNCYHIRLDFAFKYAKENGFDAVTTALLVSPYQDHELIIKIANELSKKYQIAFYYEDFREGYRYGREVARSLGLYSQKYCGCILSRQEREAELTLKGRTL